MTEPLKPEQIEGALRRGSPEELREFERLVELQFILSMSNNEQALLFNKVRLTELGNKLFEPGPDEGTRGVKP